MTGAHSRQETARRGKSFWIALIVGALVGLSAGVGWAAFSHAGYESTGTAFVAFTFPPDEKDPFSGSQFVTQRIDSYAQLGQSAEVLRALAGDIGGRSAIELADHVRVSAVPGSVLLRITAEDSDRDTSMRIVNSMMTHLNDAVVSVEAGGPNAISPIGLVTAQPAISGPASSTRMDLVKTVACAAVGVLLGAVVGWLLTRRKSGGTVGRPSSPASPGPVVRPDESTSLATGPVDYGARATVDR